jgi:hypothetical protein
MKKLTFILLALLILVSCETDYKKQIPAPVLDKTELKIRVDETIPVSITNYTDKQLAGKTIKWISLQQSIATFENGVVKGIRPGKVVVSAEIDGVVSMGCWVTVEGVFDANNDVYILDRTHNRITIWKNGISTQYTGTEKQEPEALHISNNDIYVAGSTLISGVFPNATYWKNGIEVKLSDKISVAHDILTVGTDVYVAGYETSESGVFTATIWKNGTAMLLGSGEYYTVANGIAVVNNDIYVSGNAITYDADTKTHLFLAVYWKNGIEYQVTGSTNAYAYTVKNQNQDLYFAGHEWENGVSKAKYWKNGVGVNLSHTPENAFAHSFALAANLNCVGGYVHDAKLNYNVATYWLNGEEKRPSQKKLYGERCPIAASGTDVYLLANELEPDGTVTAKYWKNGNVVEFIPYGYYLVIQDIVAVPKKN